MNPKVIYDSINAAYNDWSTVLVGANHVRRGSTIGWAGADTDHWMPDVVSFENVRRLIEDRQYTFMVSENSSVIQLLYAFDGRGRNLLSASLAYYGNRRALDESTLDDILYERFLADDENDEEGGYSDAGSEGHRDSLATEIMGTAEAPAPWLRLDYAPEDSGSHLHAKCHVHFGGLKRTRVAVTRVPSPRQFIEFVLALFHPEVYGEHRIEHRAPTDVVNSLRAVNDVSTFCEGPDAALGLFAALRFPA